MSINAAPYAENLLPPLPRCLTDLQSPLEMLKESGIFVCAERRVGTKRDSLIGINETRNQLSTGIWQIPDLTYL